MNNKRRIIIVDDHPIVRQGFAQLINAEDDLLVCGEAEDAPTALGIIAKEKPDLVLLDISLKESNGIELIKDLEKRQPGIPILVISLHDETVYAERVLHAGARGFIMKIADTGHIMKAIRQVLSGQIYVSGKMQDKLLNRVLTTDQKVNNSPLDTLSDRELEIFQLIGEGLSTRNISEKLSLGIKTVETHKAHIKKKLNLSNSSELMRFAVKWSVSEAESKLK
jgi:DNA-binding NarL/FixJ family response regulator